MKMLKVQAVAVAILASLLMVTSSGPARAGAGCQEALVQAKAWLRNTTHLPETPDELKVVPREQRRLVLALLPAESRSLVWKSFFRSYIDLHPRLTMDQIRLIEEAFELATPEYFSHQADTRDWLEKVDLPTRDLAQRARTVFSAREYDDILVTMAGVIGGAEPGTTPGIGQCNCNLAYNNCTISGVRAQCKAIDCVTMSGCGPMGTSRCDGICQFGTAAPEPEPTPVDPVDPDGTL